MTSKRIHIRVTLALVLLLSLFPICPTSFANDNPYLEVSPATSTFGPNPVIGTEFDVSVIIKGLTADKRLVAVGFRLGYNNTLLEVVSITEGSFLQDPRWNWYGRYFFSVVEPDGQWGPHILVQTYLYPNPSTWVYDQTEFPNGEGTVAVIRFKIIYQGPFQQVDIGSLTILDIILVNADGNGISYESPINGAVTILGKAYCDIAITNLTASSKKVVKGEVVVINVTLENQGDLTENFTVYITCGQTRNLTLASKTSLTTTFYLSTSNMTGNYTLWALVPTWFGDEHPEDNIYIDDDLEVIKWPYDVTGDGYCGIDDIVAVAEHFGGQPPNWNPIYDVTGDNYVGIDDIVATAEHFGQWA